MFVFSGKNNYYAIPFKYNQNPVPVHHIFMNIQYRSVKVQFARLEGGPKQLTSCENQEPIRCQIRRRQKAWDSSKMFFFTEWLPLTAPLKM
jgi:hypothetical protein